MPYPLNAAPATFTRPTSQVRMKADGDVGRTMTNWTRVWIPGALVLNSTFTQRLAYMQVHGSQTPPNPVLPSAGGGGSPVPTSGQLWPRGR